MVKAKPKNGAWLSLSDINNLVSGSEDPSSLSACLLEEYGATKMPRLALNNPQLLRSPWAWAAFVEHGQFSLKDVVDSFQLPGKLLVAFRRGLDSLFPLESEKTRERVVSIFEDIAITTIEWFGVPPDASNEEAGDNEDDPEVDTAKVASAAKDVGELLRRLRRRILEARAGLRELNAALFSRTNRAAGDAYLASTGLFVNDDYDECESAGVKKALYVFKGGAGQTQEEPAIKKRQREGVKARDSGFKECKYCSTKVSMTLDPNFQLHKGHCSIQKKKS